MNRWNPTLRPFALFAALAAFALPARADTLVCAYGGTDTYDIETGFEWPFQVTRGSVAAGVQIKATSSDPDTVKLKSPTGAAGGSASVSLRRAGNVSDGDDTAEFTLVPVKPGNNVTITVQIMGDTDPGATITFTVNVSGSDMGSAITFDPKFPEIAEGTQRRVSVVLGSAVASQKTLNVTLAGEDDRPEDHVTVPATVSIPAGSNTGSITVRGLDGDYDFVVTLTDPDNEFSAGVLQGVVTNVLPNVSVSTDPENPTPWGSTIVKNQAATFTIADVGASDVDPDTLTYTWSFATGDPSSDPAKVWEHTWTSASPEDSYYTVWCRVTDKDGGSRTCYFAVTVLESVSLYTDTKTTLTGLRNQGGIAELTTFNILSPAGQTWTAIDAHNGRSEVTPNESVLLQALLEDGSYPFGWFSKEDSSAIKTPALRVPNDKTTATIQMPEEGSVLVQYLASYPYYTQTYGKGALLNTVLTDPFGDFDGDGLSDAWEDNWFQADMVPTVMSDQDITLWPVGIRQGDYGQTGNMDLDWLPTALYQPAPDGRDKIGWPCEDPDAPGTTNRYRVYKYPLDFSTGQESYNKSALGDQAPRFFNFVEYRGLEEDRTGGDGTDPDVFVRYAPEYVNENSVRVGERGNCPGTDPRTYDTDGDSLSDGWEYYFWTTIKYRVNPQNWRAWDPTYSLYRTASASAGIPMLMTDEPTAFSFTIDPTESYVIDPAEGTYMTTYEVDKKVIDDNKLIPPVKAGTVRVEFEGSEFYLVTVQGKLTTDGYDKLFYQKWGDTDDDGVADTPYVDENGDPVLVELSGAWVNAMTAEMHFPGWDVLTALDDAGAADVGMTTQATITFERLNGIFTQQHLLSRFDPMNWTKSDMGNMSDVVKALGLNPSKWDPDSDLDGDGVLDVEEYFLGTDPLHWDTDRDGMPDGWEVQRGLNPISPLNGDGTGPRDNPDEDYMAWDATGTYKHIYAYLADGELYWNGSSYSGFVPGRAAVSGAPYSNLEEFLYSYYGVTSGLWFDAWWFPIFPKWYGEKYFLGIYPTDWYDTTSDPCDNDTNKNGIPDGWEAYVGWNPIDGKLVTPLVAPPPDEADTDVDGLALRQEFSCVEAAERWSETRTVFIGPNASTTENATTTVDAEGNTNTVYSTTGEGTQVTIRALPHVMPAWTNKKLPTDPWNGDTDGDGIGDASEYSDDGDRNGDGLEFANFNPCSADTDLDWLPDPWEWFMGTYTTNQTPGVSTSDPYGPFGDPDGDGLANFQEYLTAANYGWRHDLWYPLAKQQIWQPQPRFLGDFKYSGGDWPYDPGLVPSKGPVVRAHKYTPMDFFTVPVSTAAISKGLVALKTLEKRWAVTAADSPSIGLETHAAFVQRLCEIVYNPFDNGPDGPSKFMDDTRPSVDPNYNTDGVDIPGKKYFQHHSVEEHWAIVNAWEGITDFLYSYAQCPYSWDPAILNTPSGVPYTYIPLNDNSVACGFPGTRPKDVDSDHDGMPDYWEIFHALNPCYGGCIAISDKAGSEADSDWDGADNWAMGSDPNFVLNLRLIPAPAPSHRQEHIWYPFYPNTMIKQSFGDGESGPFGLLLERAHYDLVNRPWLAGDPSADCDHDGVNNKEEAYDLFAPDLGHHTDPSPYWMTDITQSYGAYGQAASHVNLYYWAVGGYDYYNDGFGYNPWPDPSDWWWWEEPFTGNSTCNDPPEYLWDFEINEGYDTDNDNISDREELVSASTRGKTDPQDFDNPRARKAMYFDGYAACRTQRPFFHDQYALTSFTVELWVRPEELPAPGKVATLLQRPVMMPVDTVSGTKAWAVRNTFFVYLDEFGVVRAEVDNDAIEQPANQAVVVSNGRLVPNAWSHVAVVMDSRNDLLSLYINGEYAGHVSTALKPCTGTIMDSSYQNWITSEGGPNGIQTVSTTTVNFDYSPAPIVVGAYDTTPWSVIGLNPDATFDENRFFKGWIDEIRIWDRCRTQTEIVNNMTKRFTKEDIEAINHPRFVWDVENLYSSNAEADFPQKLLYHYSFDNLPDLVPDPGRPGENVFSADTDPLPDGWSKISATRPVAYVPWWQATKNKSTVYSSDLSYVPVIENTAAHMPKAPPHDIKELVPVYDGEWNLAGYRYRLSADWSEELDSEIMSGDKMIGDVAYQYEGTGAEALVRPSRLVNSMDPYGDLYASGVSSGYSVNPWNFGGMLDLYGVYEGTPVHSDMVPLLDAVADIDVPMWDGKGAGWDQSAIDADGDGLPDWWEIAHGLDPNDDSGVNGSYGDADGDGLDNWGEYLAGTDPFAYDSDSDGYSDYYSRPDGTSLTYGELYDDGDGMDNAWEIAHGLSPNRFDAAGDFDGDGWSNWEEFMAGTLPDNSVSFPTPTFNVTFDYDGVVSNTENLVVYSYGERTAGTYMGGPYDGKYTLVPNISYGTHVLGTDGTTKFGGETYNVTHMPFGHVAEATITIQSNVNGTNTLQTLPIQHWNEEYGAFISDINGFIGLAWESGDVFCTDEYVGTLFQLNVTIDGYTFPFTARDMLRTTGTHMVGGNNRYIGFIDDNYNGEYDVGEPMGLSTPRPTLASWDAVSTEIPMTDDLWDYPRVSWAGFVPTNFSPTMYIVTFQGEGKVTVDPGSSSTITTTIGVYNDLDGDGLDAWMEGVSGTSPNKMDTDGDGRLDYDEADAEGGRTWGEWLDDGDGMPAAWEMAYGVDPYYDLDPHLYDADKDLDDDGWSNWAEFMANTDPANPDSFPEPQLDVTFRYDGEKLGTSTIKVFAYSEKKQGSNRAEVPVSRNYMGGHHDGLYTTLNTSVGLWGDASVVEALETQWGSSYVGSKNVSAATILVYRDGSETEYQANPFYDNPNYGIFVDDENARIFIEWSTGLILTQFYGEKGEVSYDYQSCAPFSPSYRVTYSTAGVEFPMTVANLSRDLASAHNHMVEGYNRFLAFMDLDTSGEWDPGEPMGLSLYDSTLVGYDSVFAEIPLTDGLFGFERFKWPTDPTQWDTPAATNQWGTHYVVFIQNSANEQLAPLGIRIETPRNFLHEGDYIGAGLNGLKFSSTNELFKYTVMADDGTMLKTVVKDVPFRVIAGPKGGRRKTEAIYPKAGNVVHGSLVEFQWKMDSRTEGVQIQVTGPGVNLNEYVPFPVRHNKVTDDDYYYSYVPQLENGKTVVEFPDGNYTYTITPYVNGNILDGDPSMQPISDTFRIDRKAANVRDRASISGTVHYYGRMADANGKFAAGTLYVQAYKLPDGAGTSVQISGNPVAKLTLSGATTSPDPAARFSFTGLAPGNYAVLAFVDVNGNGIADVGETQGMGFLGGCASPLQIPNWYPPIRIAVADGAAKSVEDVHVVLRDRDLNGDGIPELARAAGITDVPNYLARPVRTFPDTKADTWESTCLFDKNFKPYSTRTTTTTTGGGSTTTEGKSVQFVVKAPRTFLHEGDWIREGALSDKFGFDLADANSVKLDWNVVATDGYYYETNAGGTLVVFAGTDESRREMKAVWPTQLTKVYGTTVQFEWEMDYRNSGVRFEINGITDPSFSTNIVVPLPVRHGRTDQEDYYYTAVPQMEDGLRFLDLPDGQYEYTITEIPGNSTMITPQSVTERFQLDHSGTNRALYAVSGGIRYYGKVMEQETVATIGTTDGTTTSYALSVDPALLHPGAMGVVLTRAPAGGETANWPQPDPDVWAAEVFNDSAANGILFAAGTGGYSAWSGTIDYETGAISLLFSEPPEAGLSIRLAVKKFPASPNADGDDKGPLYIQAFRLPDNATTATAVSGNPVAQVRTWYKGAFAVSNLAAGTYAIRAFVDSNGNGIQDGWETQGVAVRTGTVSPNLDSKAAPIVVKGDVTGLMIVLHDRDTDNDLLPDSWEWWKTDGSLDTSGYDMSDAGGLFWWQEYADGVLDSDPRTPDTDLDGLTDAMELLVTKTDTHLKDTDGDGVGDLEEFLSGSDPLDAEDAVPYAIPALEFDGNGKPFVDVAYPALKPGVVLTFELQRKLSLDDKEWETVCDYVAKNEDGTVLYGEGDGVNAHMSPAGTARMKLDEDVDYTTGFFRIKVFADYGEMRDNGDGTWSYWTWVKTGANAFEWSEAARGEGTLVRDADGNWSFVSDATGAKGALVRDADGNWSFQK